MAVEDLIHSGSMFTVERRDSPDGAAVALKYPTATTPQRGVLARLEREYEIGVGLNLPNVRKVFGRTERNGRPAIEFEYIPGETFKTHFRNAEHRHIETVLHLASSAAHALESLHAAGVIHHDIAATNLLVRKDTGEAVIIDLEFATRDGGDDNFALAVEGQLPYLAPEQSGRIDLPVDERSDLYSFGVVLYEMLTGELPFQAEDSAGWIHAHLARLPEPPLMRVPELPRVVSDIVLRLLAKTPENRYQTARGLYRDLTHCLDQLHDTGNIDNFSLGHGDHSGRLRFPAALYGRKKEQRQLNNALQQTVAGQPGLQLISGFAGAGKTALVNELRFPVAATGGRFISGKFDQTLRALPYAAFANAFTQLCHQLLAGTPDELESFRNRVLETLGTNAGLLLEFVPILQQVIGPQPPPPPLETVESANRFAITLLGFFHCMVEEKHPLILFLDDVQWADAASLELLYMIITRSVRNHFMIICAYRDNELPPEHPLPELIVKLQQEWPHISHLSLGGLTVKQTTALIAGALDTSTEEAMQLATLIHAKTDGNPFFMRQLLETLVSEEVVRFDPQKDSWQWESERVQALNISDNVIELMLRKIARLPHEVHKILQVASCIGNTFPLQLLVDGADHGKESPRKLLAPAVDEGLVAFLGANARFTHDRIQQAVYQTLATEEAQQIHLRLGRHLLAQRHTYDMSLAAVQQLDLGLPLIDTADERRKLATLNLEAGNTARASMAYAEAKEFYVTGEKLLTLIDDKKSATLFELRFHQAEVGFFLGEVATAIERLRELLHDAPDFSARARIYQLLLDIQTVEINLSEALATGNDALAELGVAMPQEQSFETLLAGVNEIEQIVSERGIKNIANWPEMHDIHELAIAGLLTHLAPPAYISAAQEFPFIAIEFARRALQGGLSRYAPFAFSVFGMLLAVALQRYDSACRMGLLATEIARRQDSSMLRARANFFHAVFILHWCEPLEATLPYLDDGWKSGVESGDLQFASYCINHIHGNGLFAGQSLVELEQSLVQFDDVNRIIRQEDGQHFFSMLKRCVGILLRPAEDLPHLAVDHGGEAIVEVWRNKGNATILSLYHVLRCLVAVILEKPVEALEEAEQASAVLDGVKGMTWVPQHHFIHTLALADAIREERLAPSAALTRIGKYRDQLEAWAKQSPDNYRPKLLLIEAETEDLAGEDHGTLLDAYDTAIDAASHAGRTLDHALACERAAACWLRRNKPQLAGHYLRRALAGYETWGAEAKVSQLMRAHSALLLPLHPRSSEGETSSSSSGDELHAIDIYSVLKAAQTVAGELVIDRMLSRLIGLVIETAGAQSGFLLLEQDNEWRVVAAQLPDRASVEVLQWRSLSDYPEIAATVVQYVARTKKAVNLDDATKSTLFAADSSITARHCKSLLCLPIINRGELGGILYLENNLASHAFTRTHTRILQLLTTQAISSLEISRYYARVQNLNRSLEEEIEERKRTESKLEFLANHDALTELPNRRLFYDRVKHAIQRAQRSGGRVAVLFLDLDQFKNINDTLSHQVGDQLLQQVAQRLAAQVREEDTLGRLGGDEYVLLMEGNLELSDLSRLAEKLLATFREPIHVAGHELHPTGSMGISLYPDDASDADHLLRNADAAMYQAKQLGRNSYRFFSAKLAEVAAERLALEQDLRRAIANEEFELYYQPQVALESSCITGAEVLLRWNHPRRGLLLPQSFIPVAEESGNIIAIGEWVLRHACLQLEQWHNEGLELANLAINVSGSQFSPHSGFASLVKRVIDNSNIDPANLELELTESVIMQDTEFTMRSLDELNALGVRLAIDDFGTGYSSLSYLHRLPVQRLKIDRTFVNGLPHAQDSAMIVQSIMLLGQNLGKQVIAEGIENEAQQHFLQQAGCTEGQGYLFGESMPLSEFDKLLRRGSII